MILMICGDRDPERLREVRTVTPDWTVTGPVGGDDLAPLLAAACSPRSRAWRASWRGRAAPRVDHDAALAARPAPPWRGRTGRFGRLGPDWSAIGVSVEARRAPDRPGPCAGACG